MAKPQLKRTDENAPGASSTDDYAPKQYSAREHAAMGLKIFLITGLLFGLMWVINALKAQ